MKNKTVQRRPCESDRRPQQIRQLLPTTFWQHPRMTELLPMKAPNRASQPALPTNNRPVVVFLRLMIVGVGLDLCLVSRMEKRSPEVAVALLQEYSPATSVVIRKPRPAGANFAARFAAKEAILKALGVPEGLSWHELEIAQRPSGGPQVVLHGVARQAALALGISVPHLSLTHQGDAACAVVIAERWAEASERSLE